jgi:hypothetical protein
MADTGLLQEWGKLIAGQWTMQSATAAEGGTLVVANGSHTVSWMEGHGALEAICIPPLALADQTASTGTRWVAVLDSATGQIKQTTVGADGTTEVAYIAKQNGQWGWKQTRNFPNGVTETNCATFVVSNGGRTITQHVTERTLSGAVQPLEGYVPSSLVPTLANVCVVMNKVST